MDIFMVIMILLAAVGFVAGAVFFVLFLQQRKEMKSIDRQLSELIGASTNQLVHTENGLGADLIKTVNSLLTRMQTIRVEYARRSHTIDQMLTNISHDLRTPLTSAMGYMNLVLDSNLSEEEKERELEIVRRRLVRLEELINSFFEFSSIISRGEAPKKEPMNLVQALEEAVSHAYDDFSAAGRKIDLQCEGRKWMLDSNYAMLMRIFDNLIGNAKKHGIGDLTILAQKTEEGYRVEFTNPSPESIDVSRVFDEFYTTDISRTNGSSGLGLAIAKQFTEMLGGKITAKTEEGNFTIGLEFAISE
ncbi:MAG: HAMP domain-containing histidine kinase [Lachnospiraceae bacterium]|nr:HAMP domain-containing histidine kinase [Lachnospiraceae bacterium]